MEEKTEQSVNLLETQSSMKKKLPYLSKKFLAAGGIFLLGLAIGVVTYKLITRPPQGILCTQEAKICPDGSSVGRTGPNCEFSPCPTVRPDITQPLKPTSISSSHNTFGLNILRQIWKTETESNIFISPSSIALALSMVYNGADGGTKESMAKTLQVQDIDIAEVNRESAALINFLENPDPKVQLSIANSIWGRQGLSFNPEFLTTNQTYYKAEIKTLNFDDPNAAKTINSWVSQKTKGKIPTIVSPPIPRDMVMFLINAIYFKGTWTTEFDKKLTTQRDFNLTDGSKKKVSMMSQGGKFPYLANDLFQAVSLPYGEKKNLSMYVFLPQKDLDGLVKQMDADKWNLWISQFQETKGTILLPKFKTEYKRELKDDLTSLGMGVAFSGGANFDKIGPNLTISEVIHKTFVDVNEEGTEAAAVTAVGVGATAVRPVEKTFYLEVNKPFLFAIVDNQSSEILFIGTIKEP